MALRNEARFLIVLRQLQRLPRLRTSQEPWEEALMMFRGWWIVGLVCVASLIGSCDDSAGSSSTPDAQDTQSADLTGDSAGGDTATGVDTAQTPDTAAGSDTSGGGDTGSDQSSNAPPTVDAGSDSDVLVDAAVNLLGSASDPDPGDTLSFMWTQLSGPTVTLADPTSLATSFVASVPDGSQLVMQLEACDGEPLCAQDTVTFNVFSTLNRTYVAKPPVGSDSSGDGTRAAPFETVAQGQQAAAALVQSTSQPAEVFIAAGVYDESISMVEGVHLVGGFEDTGWTRDVSANITTLRSPDVSAITYAVGGGFATPTAARGLILEVTGTAVTTPFLAAVVVQEGSAVLEDLDIVVPSASALALGVEINPRAASTVTLSQVTIRDGDVAQVDGVVVGLRVDASQASASVTGDAVTVQLAAPTKRTRVGAAATSGASLTLTNSAVSVAATTDTTAITTDAAIGVSADAGSRLDLTNVVVDPGGGYTFHSGIVADASQIRLDNVTASGGLDGGSSAGGAYLAAVTLLAGATAVIDDSTLTGGELTRTAIANLSFAAGLFSTGGSSATVTRTVLDAGTGDVGAGALLRNAGSTVFTDCDINQTNNGAVCSGSRACVGISVEGASAAFSRSSVPSAPGYSCCDPAAFAVVVENSRVTGGTAGLSRGLVTSCGPGNSGTAPFCSGTLPSVCVNASTIDAGDCGPNAGAGSACIGLDQPVDSRIMVHNSTIYGGTSQASTIGVRTVSASGEPSFANNYIHGGDPTPSSSTATTSTGMFFVNGRTASGHRVLNNIIYSGSGSSQYAAFEENHNSDPGRFMRNNLVASATGGSVKSVLYRNCDATNCAMEYNTLSEINTLLNANGQGTFGQGGTLSDAGCMVDDAPRGGDPTQASGSTCVDAGLERNASCNICQTPWVDRDGTHRIGQAFTNLGAPCPANGASMLGDNLPDIGPAEQ